MNQIVNEADLVSAIPLDKPLPRVMTRREKLLHWAGLIRNSAAALGIYHRLEYYDAIQLAGPVCWVAKDNVFGVAFCDPLFNAMGLVGAPHTHTNGQSGATHVGTAKQVMDFFELTQSQLHEFSCDCGGAIRNHDMADRIERLAGPAAGPVIDSASWTGRF